MKKTSFAHRFTHFLLAFLLIITLLGSFYPLILGPLSAASQQPADTSAEQTSGDQMTITDSAFESVLITNTASISESGMNKDNHSVHQVNSGGANPLYLPLLLLPGEGGGGSDENGPMIEILAPRDRQSVYTAQPTIEISYSDFDSSVNSGSLVVQLVPENGTSTDITNDLTVTESGAQGTVSTALADDTTYTLSVSLADDVGHTSRTSISFYIPPDPEDITPPDAPEDAGWVSGVIYDSATCNEHLTTCQGVAGVEVSLSLINTEALERVREARKEQIEREWLTRSKAPAPMDANVAESFSQAVDGTVVTGPDGFFAFPVSENGTFWLRAEKNGYTYGQREAQAVLERSTATSNIYLTPLDSAVTTCDDKGCMHNSSDGSMQLEIPAGAIASGESREVSATNFEQVQYLPSGDLPPGTEETYAFNLGGDSEITFDKEITVRQKNERGFAPGSRIPLGYWNQITQQWEHAGTGIVDAAGEWIEMGVTHFSNYDCNDPITQGGSGGDPNDNSGNGSGSGSGNGGGNGGGDGPNEPPPPPDPTPTPTEEPCDKEGGCVIDLKTGTLAEDITLPAVNVLGEATAPTLLYNTNRANPSEIIDIALSLNPEPGVEFGNHIGFELYIEGEVTDEFFFSAEITSGETGRYRYMWDARDAQGQLLPPGAYDYAVKFSIPYRAQYCYALNGIFGNPPDCENGATGVFTDAVEEIWVRGTIELDTQVDSSLGAGWVLDGQQRLYVSADGDILISDGNRLDEFLDLGRVQSTVQRYPQRKAPVLAPSSLTPRDEPSATEIAVSPSMNPVFEPGLMLDSDEEQLNAEQTANPNSPPWTNIADYPINIMDNTAAEYEGLIYSVAGYDGSNRLKSTYVYDPESDTWSQLADMNHARRKPAAAFIDGLLYVAGGGIAKESPLSTILEIYNPATDSWTLGAPMPVGSSTAPGVALGGKFYVIGGCSDWECVGSTNVLRYDPTSDSWTTLAPYPEVVAWHSCGAIGSRIFCAGGVTEIPGDEEYTESNSTYVYNPATDVWTRLADMPQPQWGAFFGVANSVLLVSSGASARNITNQSFYYDPFTDTWTRFENPNHAKYRGGSACGFYKIGGSHSEYNATRNSEVYPELTDCGTETVIYSRTETDYSGLTYDSDTNTYTRTYPDGTKVHFNSDGTHDYTLMPDGRKTIYTYHSDGAVATMAIIPPGEETARWTWTFNYTSGQLDSMTDPAGRVTDVTVNAHGHLTEVEYPDNSIRRLVYDQRGLLTQQVDENGDVSAYAYDDYGRITTHTAPPHAVYNPETSESEMVSVVRHFTNSDTSYPLINDSLRGDPDNPAPPVPLSDELVVGVEYGRGQRSGETNKWGAFLSHTDSLGRTITYERDEANNVTRRIAPDGDCIEYTYDDLGNVVSEMRLDASQCDLSLAARDPSELQTWSYTYSERFNHIKTATNPLGNTTTYFYDYEDASAVGEAGKLIRVEYPSVENESGQVVTPTVSLTYNQWGLIETETDTRGTVTKYVYTQGTPDEASNGSNPLFAPGVTPVPGLLTQIIEDFGGENITTIYQNFDAAGNPQSQLDPRGNPTLYTYDALNRLLTEEDALAYVSKYEYDGQSNIIKMVRDYTVSTTGRNIVTTYTYNSYDQLLSERTVADGLVRERTNRHDINRQVVASTDANGNTSIYSYDPSNQLIAETDRLGHTTAYTYTLKGQLAAVTYADGSVTNYTYDAFGRRVQEVVDAEVLQLTTSLTYDANNNLLTMTDPAGTVTCYTYDVLNRMSTQTQDCGQLDLTTTYTYDLAGNRTRIVDPRGVATHIEYDALNRPILERRDDGGLNLESTYQYNEVGAQVSVTDPRGTVTNNEYDALNRLIAQTQDAGTNGLNLTSSFTYNRLGDQATQTDANGDGTNYEYNAFGELVTLTDPLGNVTSYTYNNIGHQIAETDPNGQVTEYTYDPLGRRTSVTNPLGDRASYVYDALGRRTQHIDANGDITQYEYDGVGRLAREINPLDETMTSQYDGVGRLTQRTDPLGHTTTYEYDGAGRLISETDALGQKSVYSYDANGNRTSMTTAIPEGGTIADGQTTSYTYDTVGRNLSEINPLGHTTTSTYNANGNLASVTDPNGNTTTFTNDTLGRQIQTSNPLGNTSSQTYDKVGRLTSITNANGDTIRYTYDAAGRQTAIGYPDGTSITRTYDPAGRLLTTVGPNTDLSVTYDAIGRTLQTQDNRLNNSVSYSYDGVGNRLTLIGPDGTVTSYEYDAADRLMKVTQGSQVFSMSYNAVGRIIKQTQPNNVETSYSYDDLNRLIDLTYRQADGTVIDRLTYELDAANNRTSVTFQNDDTIQYTYDKANQLIEEVRTGDLTYNQTFSYDSVGNRTQSTNDGTTTNYTYNVANQLTQESGPQTINYSYNARGDMIMRSGGGGDFTYSYDYDGRLTGVNGPNIEAINAYDAFNRRVTQTVNGTQINFAYDGTAVGATVLAEYDADMALLTAYTLAPRVDGRLGRTTNGSTAYYLQDGLSSTRYMLGSDGQVQSSYDYDGYGQLTGSTGSVAESYLFTNRRWDEAANLYYNRARYYTPSAGRFTQADPLGFVEGANLYRYARNNPINRVDPLGWESCHEGTRNFSPANPFKWFSLIPFGRPEVKFNGNVKVTSKICDTCCKSGPYEGQIRQKTTFNTNASLNASITWNFRIPVPILAAIPMQAYANASGSLSHQLKTNECNGTESEHESCGQVSITGGIRGGLTDAEFLKFKAQAYAYGQINGNCKVCLDAKLNISSKGCQACAELGVHAEIEISDWFDPISYDKVFYKACKDF